MYPYHEKYAVRLFYHGKSSQAGIHGSRPKIEELKHARVYNAITGAAHFVAVRCSSAIRCDIGFTGVTMTTRPRHYKRKVPYPPPGHNDLQDVLTIQEAAALWFKHPSTLRYHIDKGNIAARKSGQMWLISKESMLAYYGHSPLIRTRKRP